MRTDFKIAKKKKKFNFFYIYNSVFYQNMKMCRSYIQIVVHAGASDFEMRGRAWLHATCRLDITVLSNSNSHFILCQCL